MPLRGTQALLFSYYFILGVEQEESSLTVSGKLIVCSVMSTSVGTYMKRRESFSPVVVHRQYGTKSK